MNRKGQALVEFVLILPVFLFILFIIIDFGRVFTKTNQLESDSNDIIQLFKNGTSISELKSLYLDNKLSIVQDGEYYKFVISASVDLVTPGLNRIMDDPYVISVERIVPYA